MTIQDKKGYYRIPDAQDQYGKPYYIKCANGVQQEVFDRAVADIHREFEEQTQSFSDGGTTSRDERVADRQSYGRQRDAVNFMKMNGARMEVLIEHKVAQYREIGEIPEGFSPEDDIKRQEAAAKEASRIQGIKDHLADNKAVRDYLNNLVQDRLEELKREHPDKHYDAAMVKGMMRGNGYPTKEQDTEAGRRQWVAEHMAARRAEQETEKAPEVESFEYAEAAMSR